MTCLAVPWLTRCLFLGTTDHKSPLPTEAVSGTNARRSIVIKHDLPAGHKLTVMT